MHFQRCEHLAELPAREVIRQVHDQPLGVFNGRKKCIHMRIFVDLISRELLLALAHGVRRADGRRAQEATTRAVKMIGATNVTAGSPTARWEAAAPV